MPLLPKREPMTPSQWEAYLQECNRRELELSKQLQPPILDKYLLLDWEFEAIRWQRVVSWADERGLQIETYVYPTIRGISTVLDIKPTRVRNSASRTFKGKHSDLMSFKPISELTSIPVIEPEELLRVLIDLADRKPRVQKAIDIVLALRDRWHETQLNRFLAYSLLPKRVDYGQRG